jgi:hypothetical protein
MDEALDVGQAQAHRKSMTLLFDQSKAIEKALGEEAAKPIIEAINTVDARTLADLRTEVATKADIVRLEGEIKRLEVLVKVLIGLTALAVAFFSPVAEKLLALVK